MFLYSPIHLQLIEESSSEEAEYIVVVARAISTQQEMIFES